MDLPAKAQPQAAGLGPIAQVPRDVSLVVLMTVPGVQYWAVCCCYSATSLPHSQVIRRHVLNGFGRLCFLSGSGDPWFCIMQVPGFGHTAAVVHTVFIFFSYLKKDPGQDEGIRLCWHTSLRNNIL